MMAVDVPESFERVMGCEARELLACEVLAPRRSVLLQIPQLRVTCRFDGFDDDRRREIQRRFDLATQQGGG